MVGWPYELQEEAIFLNLQQKADLHDKFQSEGFQLSLDYLVNIFEALNAQGKTSTFSLTVTPFEPSEPNTTSENTKFNRKILPALVTWILLSLMVITHLTALKAVFSRYFPDIPEKREAWKFSRNPFQCEVTDVLDAEVFLGLKFNTPAKENFTKTGS